MLLRKKMKKIIPLTLLVLLVCMSSVWAWGIASYHSRSNPVYLGRENYTTTFRIQNKAGDPADIEVAVRVTNCEFEDGTTETVVVVPFGTSTELTVVASPPEGMDYGNDWAMSWEAVETSTKEVWGPLAFLFGYQRNIPVYYTACPSQDEIKSYMIPALKEYYTAPSDAQANIDEVKDVLDLYFQSDLATKDCTSSADFSGNTYHESFSGLKSLFD